jgi:hypothetical protein
MIFLNPAGAPELACDACGCRWFDRMSGTCYECGAPVSGESQAEYRRALEVFALQRSRAPEDAPPPG